jgi:hypothetical protein
MNKNMKLPIDIERIQHTGQIVLRLFIHPDAVRDWCLGLCLLNNQLVDTLGITGQRTKTGIDLNLGGKNNTRGIIRLKFTSSTLTQLEITKGDVEYLLQFFLKYYRDGMADVDHIDLDAVNADTGDKGLYVTFRVQHSKPPVTPEEAQRRLEA